VFRQIARGTTISGVTKRQLLELDFDLPPIEVQRSIVADIETQFSRLEAGVAALKRAQANLKRYRASVLKAACEGRLVPLEADLAQEQGREYETGDQLLQRVGRQPGTARTRRLPPDTEIPVPLRQALPAGWARGACHQLFDVLGGLTKNPKRKSAPRILPYLRVANVYANELRLDVIESIGVYESDLDRLLLKVGDLLIVEGNGSQDQIGRVALWNGAIDPCVHQNHLIKARPRAGYSGAFALCWLLSPDGRHAIEQVSSSTSGLHTLSVGKVDRLPIPVPPLAEQERIVAEVERRLSVVDALEATIATNLARAARLRQAVLQKAFSPDLPSPPEPAAPNGD